MELPSHFLELIALIARPRIEERMFIVMNISLLEDHLYYPLQTNKKRTKLAVTLLSE